MIVCNFSLNLIEKSPPKNVEKKVAIENRIALIQFFYALTTDAREALELRGIL